MDDDDLVKGTFQMIPSSIVSSSEFNSSYSFDATLEFDELTLLNLYFCEGVKVFTDVVDCRTGVDVFNLSDGLYGSANVSLVATTGESVDALVIEECLESATSLNSEPVVLGMESFEMGL
jgi:hypothetical protein